MQGGDQVVPSLMRRLVAEAATQALTRAQDFQIPHQDMPIPNHFEERSHSLDHNAFVGIVPILRKIATVFVSGIVLLTTSITLYGLFYLTYMPSHQVSEPLFFDYTGLVKHPSSPVVGRDKVTENDAIPLYPTASQIEWAPWAAADLFAKHTQWEPFQSDVIPAPLSENSILAAGKAHYLEVALALPESEINIGAGMFGVQVELQSSNGTKLAVSMRATRLPYESSGISFVRKAILLIPLLIGAVQESKTVVVPAFRHVVESSEQPLRYVTVRLIMQSKSRPRPEAFVTQTRISQPEPVLEVIAGEVRIGEELNDFQELLKIWFFTCYLVGISIFFVLQLMLWFIGRLWWDGRRRRRPAEDPPCELDPDGSQLGGEFDGQWETLSQQSQPSPGNNDTTNPVRDSPVPVAMDPPIPVVTSPSNPPLVQEDEVISPMDILLGIVDVAPSEAATRPREPSDDISEHLSPTGEYWHFSDPLAQDFDPSPSYQYQSGESSPSCNSLKEEGVEETHGFSALRQEEPSSSKPPGSQVSGATDGDEFHDALS